MWLQISPKRVKLICKYDNHVKFSHAICEDEDINNMKAFKESADKDYDLIYGCYTTDQYTLDLNLYIRNLARHIKFDGELVI